MIDPEKIPDCPLSEITYAGAAVISRWGKRRELEEMMSAIDRLADLAPPLAGSIVELFCDSRACADYTAKVFHPAGRPFTEAEAERVADWIERAFRAACGGYNGVTVDTGETCIHRGPWWDEPLYEEPVP